MTRRDWIVVGVVALVGCALRVWVYRSVLGAPDSDEAIVGLMALHALHGHFAVFFWGQVYGGSQEALLAVPFVAIFGVKLFAIRIVPALLCALAAVLVWRVGRRTFGERAGIAAGLLFWVWPPYLIVHGTPAYGFYGTNVVYVALLLLLALHVVERPSNRGVALFGLVLGLAYWQTAQIIPVALPIIAWVIWRRPDVLRRAWLALCGAAVGASPWIVWNLRHGGGSVLRPSHVSDYLHGLRLFASPLLPMLLGLRAPLAGTAVVPVILMYLLYVALLAAFVVGAVRARATDASLLYVVAIAFPFVWAVSHRVTILTSHPVYLLVLSPVAALLLGQLGTSRARTITVLGACVAVVCVTFVRMEGNLQRASDEHWPPPTPRSLGPLEKTLERFRIQRAYADYWIAYRVTFDEREKVIATPDQWQRWTVRRGVVTPIPSSAVRYRPYQRAVAAASRHAFVFFRHPYEPVPIRNVLRRQGYRRLVDGPFEVWVPGRSQAGIDNRRENLREIG